MDHPSRDSSMFRRYSRTEKGPTVQFGVYGRWGKEWSEVVKFRGIADSNVCLLDRKVYICIECFVYSKEVNTLPQENLKKKGANFTQFPDNYIRHWLGPRSGPEKRPLGGLTDTSKGRVAAL